VHLEPRFTDFPNLHLNLEVRFEEIVEPHPNLRFGSGSNPVQEVLEPTRGNTVEY
jgi:hypothetical protein